MKAQKFLFLILTLTAVLFFSCQEAEAQDRSKTLGANTWVWDVPVGAGDTIGAGDSTRVYQVQVNKPHKLLYDIYYDIDSVGGTAATTPILVQGKVHADDSWTTITTINWTGTVDTTFHSEQYTTAQKYRYYQTTITGSTSTFVAKVTKLWFRFCRLE